MQDAFAQAQQDVQALTKRPGNDVLLKLYALYKQATEGDVQGDRPGGFDFRGAAKHDAWAEQRGKSADDAKREYIDLVNSLRG
ncbi:acyl-CoA-binding protein [Deinococcus maricopensis]|uniref:Acyl-coA-binding protein ACBP n=1 Tax=Deinococcus maricopensis (strain DSM 21211 / LMG 22137 / NRRL B-23946 / LB-34) TaxID=709986 RepID=E8U6A0_DEIML|nr:acyl-CoA-binding protein [Deinococcus maricopensis]ADV66589.1 acyl-coA-binding protein ACBP [Deinococcus maricopensis DSM 21211]